MNHKDKLKVVFFGLGSIGARLARLVQTHFDFQVYAFRHNGRRGNTLAIPEFNQLSDLKAIRPDVAFVTNPTAFHIETALECARQGMHLFVEKPLGQDLDHAAALQKSVEDGNLTNFVACNLRFDPLLQYLNTAIQKENLFYARVICSSYLPDWRPEQDYRKNYSAHTDMGGGVLLDLIHEIDYCSWFFGGPLQITGRAGKLSDLEIHSEDYADLTLCHAGGMVSHIHLDYFGLTAQRKIQLFGPNIQIEADLLQRFIHFRLPGGDAQVDFPAPDRDEIYLAELKYFFDCLATGRRPMNTIEDHLRILEPLLAFRNQKNGSTFHDRRQDHTRPHMRPGRVQRPDGKEYQISGRQALDRMEHPDRERLSLYRPDHRIH